MCGMYLRRMNCRFAHRIGDEKVAEAEKTGLSLEAWLMIGLVVSVGLSTLVIAVVSAGKTTVFSPYQNDDEFQEQQLTLMRESLEVLTSPTPCQHPCWSTTGRNPHRTLLVIAAPEKPFDAAEAAALHDFVTERAGKVILLPILQMLNWSPRNLV